MQHIELSSLVYSALLSLTSIGINMHPFKNNHFYTVYLHALPSAGYQIWHDSYNVAPLSI